MSKSKNKKYPKDVFSEREEKRITKMKLKEEITPPKKKHRIVKEWEFED